MQSVDEQDTQSRRSELTGKVERDVGVTRVGRLVKACGGSKLLACLLAAVCGSWWAGGPAQVSHKLAVSAVECGRRVVGTGRMLRRNGSGRDQSRTSPSGAAGPGAAVSTCKKVQLNEPRCV